MIGLALSKAFKGSGGGVLGEGKAQEGDKILPESGTMTFGLRPLEKGYVRFRGRLLR